MLIVNKKIRKGIDPVLGEIRNQHFQRRRKKLETVSKTQISQTRTDVPFRILGDTGWLSVFKFFQTIKQDVHIETAHLLELESHSF